jgi:hypothetical protein
MVLAGWLGDENARAKEPPFAYENRDRDLGVGVDFSEALG